MKVSKSSSDIAVLARTLKKSLMKRPDLGVRIIYHCQSHPPESYERIFTQGFSKSVVLIKALLNGESINFLFAVMVLALNDEN